MTIPQSRLKVLRCHCSILVGLCLAFLTICLALNGAEPAVEKERPKIDEEKEKRFWDQVIEAERIDFLISGIIVDDKGAVLSNVTVNVTEERSRVWASPAKKNWTKKIDGKFRLKIKKVSGVTLAFEKEGYYGADLDFRIPKEMNQEDEIVLADEEGRKPRLKRFVNKLEDIQVVLEKKGQLTQLGIFVGGLSYHPDGSGTVVDFDRTPSEVLV